MIRSAIGVLLGTTMIGLAGCQPPPQQSEDLAEIKEQQAKIIEKLDALIAAAPAKRPTRATEDYNKVHKLDYTNAPLKGNPDAPVTLAEFSDFQCPYCAKVISPLMELLEKYPNKLRIAFKHFPLTQIHPIARPAAIAAMAAKEQGCFWEFHDVLFEKTTSRQLAANQFETYAKDAGCDVAKFSADLVANKAAYEKIVDADRKEGADADVRGTPSLYINGKKVRNRSLIGMSAMVDAAFKDATGGD
jgi:protein-disulfide isomerase